MYSDSEDDAYFDVSNAETSTDDGFFDADEGTIRKKFSSQNSSARNSICESPADLNPTYIQLKNLAGLISPVGSGKTCGVYCSSSSVVSSLSSDRYSDQADLNVSKSSINAPSNDRSFSNGSSEGEIKLDMVETRLIYELSMFKAYFHEGSNKFENRVAVTQVNKPKNSLFSKDKLQLVQTIKFHEGAIWTMKFSPNGNYLCTAGQDTKVIIWRVLNQQHNSDTPAQPSEDTKQQESADKDNKEHKHRHKHHHDKNKKENKHWCFDPFPFRFFEGHTSDVIDVAWSKSNFILSASTDKTVRLWHVTRNDCLQFFRHPDIVTSVEFHPAHDRYFISGCFDRRLRLWDIIPDGNVREWAQTPDTITCVCFSPDGQTIAVGLLHGQIYFYDYEGMKYKTQMHCKNRSGKHKAGTKVTGICFHSRDATETLSPIEESSAKVAKVHKKLEKKSPKIDKNTENVENSSPFSDTIRQRSIHHLLVTTNDSRIRLCGLDDYSQKCKYKGLRNNSMQIKASYSENYSHIICGSEDGTTLIWDAKSNKSHKLKLFSSGKNRVLSYESFNCTEGAEVATTVSIFAPAATVLFLLSSNNNGNTARNSNNNSGDFGSNEKVDHVDLNAENADTKTNKHTEHNNNERKNNYNNSHNNNSGSDFNIDHSGLSYKSSPETDQQELGDLCTRIIISADYDGVIHCFMRVTC